MVGVRLCCHCRFHSENITTWIFKGFSKSQKTEPWSQQAGDRGCLLHMLPMQFVDNTDDRAIISKTGAQLQSYVGPASPGQEMGK